MRTKKNIQNASLFTEHENVTEKILTVDAFETALRSKPYRISIDQQLIEGQFLHQK